MEYRVQVKQVLTKVVELEADNMELAEQAVQDMLDNGDISMLHDDDVDIDTTLDVEEDKLS
jgi:hypothetical protein